MGAAAGAPALGQIEVSDMVTAATAGAAATKATVAIAGAGYLVGVNWKGAGADRLTVRDTDINGRILFDAQLGTSAMSHTQFPRENWRPFSAGMFIVLTGAAPAVTLDYCPMAVT